MTVSAPMRVPYAYLDRLFADPEPFLDDIRRLVKSGDFTLGYPVSEFEGRAIAMSGIPHAVGVANGTAALTLALRALGVGPGDEVITAANSFVASAGAVAMAGATPVLVDNREDFTIDPEAVERAITARTKAIIPVHLTGNLADMGHLAYLAATYGLALVEDAAQAFGATDGGKHAGSWGDAAGISLHPLKMMNVWGDGGLVLTKRADLDAKLRLLRNHGLQTRDDAVIWGDNGRLSSLQAVIANRVIAAIPWAIERRRQHAATLNAALADLAPRVQTPSVRDGVKPVYQTYVLRCADREGLRAYLLGRGIEVKVHYPAPIHLQTVGRSLGYAPGACPVAERHAETILTLPLNEFLTDDDLGYMAEAIHDYYRRQG